ncbi:carbohydrate ABC transporter permease [Sediminispirochaeta smaragdinae]|jgi:multiple sugar transport system permease protein|uniref:Binding-protein-dependent transport systems inner membrane component n=1 Tax=Sediminispirochaeta smaragdinae (strain DSM 11293 / JCM 15392 / SEBR 4228) TaxID=573413 RepID=E1RC66_SEDSS|nr:carbohydrate ABC transporter permease [Sediminispirochaeta smaragdinae]ADK79946.1 binding-protein-dependent transport systems inner membrane component [Sediminispirochaeta smaragdinae DSM 11293]
MTRTARKKTTKRVSYLLLTCISICVAFPIIWLVITSLKTYPEIYGYPITYYPHTITFEHYQKISDMGFFKHFINSIIVSGGTMLLSVLIGLFPAYAFSRYSFRGRGGLMASALLFQMFPMAVLLLPIFRLLHSIGLLDTHIGLILAYLPFTTPITIVFLRSFFISVPKALEEAAVIDGCNLPQAFVKVILPVALPGIAAVGIYTFLFSWAELMYSMSILVTEDIQNIPAFLSVFVGEYQTRWGPLFAGSIVSMLPPLVMFMLMQRYFIAGLTSGSVKG